MQFPPKPELALILFLMACGRSALQAKKSALYADRSRYRLFTQALFAGTAARVVGGCFARPRSTTCTLVMIGYTCVLVRLGQPVVEKGKEKLLSKAAFADAGKPRPVRSLRVFGS